MKPSFQQKCAHIQAGVLAVLSVILVWLPTLDTFFHMDRASMPNENRALARFPEFQSSPEGLREYINGLELYYNDHFGFRKRLIRFEQRWKRLLFKEIASDDAMFGRDGWLYCSSQDMIEIVQGINRFTPDNLKAWQKLLESRRDWCVQHGSAYIFVIPPDKQSIYPEYLPDWLLPVKKPTKLDQFMAYMKTNSTVPILDLRPALLDAKTNGILYLLTDSHWNRLGAFVGYQSLINALSNQLPGLKPLPLDAFERKFVPEQGQELAKFLGREESMNETGNVIFSPLPPLKPLPTELDEKLLAKKGVKFNRSIFTENPEGKGIVVIFHDSYAYNWQPILGYNFNRVYFAWQYNWDMDFLEQLKPDLVIDEMLERFVLSKDPTNLKEN
jgi:alginate O-acetyltransferase complex protein AlgJ